MPTARLFLALLALAVVMMPATRGQAEPVGCMGGAAEPAIALKGAHPGLEDLEKAFASAAKEFGVPVEILEAVGYKESA